jgi:SnoaL-like domain
MTAATDSLIHEYARRYSAREADGVTELCLWPFVAIREGEAIHLADRDAVRDHFTAMIDAYRDAGYVSFVAVAIDTRQLGERAAFATVRWHALDADGEVARDTQTTYHLLATPDGWRILSYTNHF